MEFKSLEAADSKHLERQFLEEQVVTALHQISREKAPGPNGFTLAFFQQCWEVVKVEVLNTIQEFYEHEEFERSLNFTFVVLIPSKVAFFMWLATHDKNLTIDNVGDDIMWWSGALCVRGIAKGLICFYNVRMPGSCGRWFFVCLESNGQCLARWRSYWLVGREEVSQRTITQYGMLFWGV